MNFNNLTFIVTDDCNYNCRYCRQEKEKKYLKRSTIDKAVAFFYPFLRQEAAIFFYGGEPLLGFDMIKHAVSLLQERNRKEKKKLQFSITTNGSLLTDETLRFFDLHCFIVMLSFDGIPHEMTRKPGSLVPTRELIQRIQKGTYPGIEFSTNSVFTPATVNFFSVSLQDILESGVTEFQFSIARDEPWNEAALLTLEKEMKRLTDFLVSYYKEKGTIPVTNFFPPNQKTDSKTFVCDGGRNRMAITPEEHLWGCSLFHGYLKEREGDDDYHTYSFGRLDDFIKNHDTIYPQVVANYAPLRQASFFTEQRFCFLCEEVDICTICPLSVSYATSFIGKIPPWMCRLMRIEGKEKKRFWEAINT